jgi:hypothetical protein
MRDLMIRIEGNIDKWWESKGRIGWTIRCFDAKCGVELGTRGESMFW